MAAPRSQRSEKMEACYFFFKRKLHIFLKAYVVKLEINYIDIWGSGGGSPQKPATSQRIR